LICSSKPIEIDGTGNFDASFIGTLIDATTGLIYISNGQYYDPETGRFLTRGVNPNSANPYVPWNPIGAILGPLGLLSIYYSRKRGKKSSWVVILVFLAFTLTACTNPCPGLLPDSLFEPSTPANATSQAGSGTVEPTTTPPPSPNETPTKEDPCAGGKCTSTPGPTPTQTPSPNEAEIENTLQELVNYIFDNSRHPYKHVWANAERDKVKGHLDRIMGESGRQGLNTNHLAYIYATTHEESQWYNYQELEPAGGFENLYGPGSPNAAQLGNIYPGDGERYMGRGYVHLTGRGNYKTASDKLGLYVTLSDGTRGYELEQYPEKAAYGAPEFSYDYRTMIAVRGMAEGWFTGVGLSNFDTPDGNYDFYGARAIINWPGAQGGDPRQHAGNLGIDFTKILAKQCPLGGAKAGIVCRSGP
jgi:hypothetical protein